MSMKKGALRAMSRVLYCASNPTHLQNFHLPYIAALAAGGDRVWTLCSGTFSAEGAEKHVDLRMEKNVFSPINWISAFRLAGLLKRERFDLICIHTSLAAFVVRLALLLAGKRGTRVVNTVHGYLFDGDTGFLKRFLLLLPELFFRGLTDRVVVMNEWDRSLAEKHRLGREVVKIPGVGVDFSRFSLGEREEMRQTLGLGSEDILLLYPAEFSARKDQSFLIRALRKLPERVCLALPGRGALWEDCLRLASALDLEGRVFFPGQLSELGDWYAAADISVSSSRYEGLPFNIMEGMYAGKPVVASRIKGHTDLIRDGEGGFLYSWNDEEEYLDCVRTLLKEKQLRRDMGERNRRSVLDYGLDRVRETVLAAIGGREPALPARTVKEAAAE
ncbi:MAG: glycosyltransferase [Oscillospiraceae bacterium]|nr:glycosyltransferase [Oscillospiraceae bacterium]